MRRWARFVLVAAVLANTAPAAVGPPREGGFSGRVEAGVGYMASTDQLGTSGENENSGGLSSDADWYDKVLPLVLFDLRYTFQESGRTLYVKTPLGGEGPPGLALGGTTSLGQRGELDVSLLARPFGEVWKDPYLAEGNREETDELVWGAEVGWSRIAGSGLGVSYVFSRVDVDEDDVGALYGSLKRDGNIHQGRVKYGFDVGRGTVLEPAVTYARGDLEGGANSFDGYGLKLAARRFSRAYGLNLFASLELRDYDKEHPVFGKARQDRSYGLFSSFIWNFAGKRRLFADFLAGCGYRDSNIDFLDATFFLGGATIGYRL